MLPENPLQDKYPPGPKEIDAHERRGENCRMITPPEQGVVNQDLSLCPSNMM